MVLQRPQFFQFHFEYVFITLKYLSFQICEMFTQPPIPGGRDNLLPKAAIFASSIYNESKIFFALGEWTETAFSNSYEITGLNTDTYYQVNVNVESVAGTFGESEWSDTLYFKTREEDSGNGTSELDTIREQIVS